MAYQTNIDYKAIQNALKPQIDAETDPVKKAALQAQSDAAGASRNEKLASNLQTYGKYATDGELDSAAGLQAQNQLGTTYESQAKNINTYFDTAKQNANNDALSRGMARSSFVSDRMATLDTNRASSLTDNDAAKALAIQNAKTQIIDNYRTNTANQLTNEKNEFSDTIGAYSNDYQAEINRVQGNGDAADDWKIPYLQAARNQKIAEQEAAAAKAAKTSYSGGGGTSGGAATPTGTTPTASFNGTSSVMPTVATDITDMLNSGYSGTQIVALAKAALAAGQITQEEYDAYLRATRH